jgi:hypothetical protein
VFPSLLSLPFLLPPIVKLDPFFSMPIVPFFPRFFFLFLLKTGFARVPSIEDLARAVDDGQEGDRHY